jgi:dTDP-4-amino-4,6-dideoxygalactose transaminase
MKYKIPLFDINYGREEKHTVSETLHSKWISMGRKVQSCENYFSAHLNVKHAIAVTNCTAALHLALIILGIKQNDEVIVPSLTFVATVNVIKYVGAIPVFADITSYEDLTIDPYDVEAKITKKTKAVIVMHYGGFACNMDAITRIAKKYNIYVIEDAAHAPNSTYKNQKLGTIGDIGCFSFFSNKNISCAEGGMLVTNNKNYAYKARLLRSHGMTSQSYERSKGHTISYDVVELGYNYRIDDIRASLLLAQLGKLEKDTKKREKLRKKYIQELSDIKELIIPFLNTKYQSSNYIFPIILRNSTLRKRNNIREKLKSLGIETSVHYPAVHKFSIYQKYKTDLPKTEYVSENLITLPIYYSLKYRDINFICFSLKKSKQNYPI